MDSFSFLIGFVMGLVLLPTIIGVIVLLRKLDFSMEKLKNLLKKLRNKD